LVVARPNSQGDLIGKDSLSESLELSTMAPREISDINITLCSIDGPLNLIVPERSRPGVEAPHRLGPLVAAELRTI
jgi:hypothetical protein